MNEATKWFKLNQHVKLFRGVGGLALIIQVGTSIFIAFSSSGNIRLLYPYT